MLLLDTGFWLLIDGLTGFRLLLQLGQFCVLYVSQFCFFVFDLLPLFFTVLLTDCFYIFFCLKPKTVSPTSFLSFLSLVQIKTLKIMLSVLFSEKAYRLENDEIGLACLHMWS